MARVIADPSMAAGAGASSADSDSAGEMVVGIVVAVRGSLLRPLRGIQPLSPLCIVDVAAAAGWPRSVLAGAVMDRVFVRPGDDVERVRTGGGVGGGVSER